MVAPSDVTLRSDSRALGEPGLHYSAYSNWSLATYPLIHTSKVANT